MDVTSVPQDDSSTYANNKKAIYAQGADGSVNIVGSSGWKVEETVTRQALVDLQDHAAKAYADVQRGLKSPLYYHMYAIRMDLQVLADSTGFFKWTIRKDFDPKRFSRISEKRLAVYADVMGKSVDELRVVGKVDYECEKLRA